MSMNDEERTLRRQLVYSAGVSRNIEDELRACEASNAEAWGEVDVLRSRVTELEGALERIRDTPRDKDGELPPWEYAVEIATDALTRPVEGTEATKKTSEKCRESRASGL